MQVLSVAIVLSLFVALCSSAAVSNFIPNSADRCAHSSNVPECLRRAEICTGFLRRSHTRERVYLRLLECADELGILLPAIDDDATSIDNHYAVIREWLRVNPREQQSIFACAHQSMFNNDGSPRREYLKTRVVSWVGQDEPELIQLLNNNIDTCPAPNRRDFMDCVFEACYTPGPDGAQELE